jgi:hypothetical protein
VVWHNGHVAGFYSYIAFAPRSKVGVVFLTNCEKSLDELGRWAIKEAIARAGEEPAPEVHDSVKKAAEALVGYFVKEPPDSLGAMFTPHFLAEIPLERVKPLFSETFDSLGPCGGVELKPGDSPRRATLLFKFGKRNEEVVRCDLGLDAGTPPRIEYIFFPPR